LIRHPEKVPDAGFRQLLKNSATDELVIRFALSIYLYSLGNPPHQAFPDALASMYVV
jgi:hypothetical protein